MYHGGGAQEVADCRSPWWGEVGSRLPLRAQHVSPQGAVLLPWLKSQHWGQAGCDLGAPELLSGASDTQAAMEQPLLLLN